MLSPLLAHADDDPQTAALAREGGEAFVSQSLRPYLIAALLSRQPPARRPGSPERVARESSSCDSTKPAIVVAGDDRAARDLAGGLRSWLAPRSV
ncbi:MAG TPA: hypothetical protein VE127_02490, partial [Solirubrobacteraceae bacterium]|nr:hypothetical protein [Solirubrobacteraceae bacterium]